MPDRHSPLLTIDMTTQATGDALVRISTIYPQPWAADLTGNLAREASSRLG